VSFFSVLGGLVTILFIIAYIVTKKVSRRARLLKGVGSFVSLSPISFG
jgi:hypothetical protein